ncbi:hypothetical protein GCM10010987_66700 [Bradyrhizobium guangdongense]|uniref:Uncharacterized protein n=1 Tax=Bradyrhizobium guangdongense TaxID=1325090 RepID=A0AA87WDF7_9BRAD|nr:hypothetical protein GCM10010987_66700 [Bradyrhizobium guangdongense]
MPGAFSFGSDLVMLVNGMHRTYDYFPGKERRNLQLSTTGRHSRRDWLGEAADIPAMRADFSYIGS